MIERIDLDGVGSRNGKLWGLPHAPEDAALVIIPVPFEVTASFHGGTKYGPDAILAASSQIDVFNPEYQSWPPPWEQGIALLPSHVALVHSGTHDRLRDLAVGCIRRLEAGAKIEDEIAQERYVEINCAGEQLAKSLQSECARWLDRGKLVAILGGDHSTPLGLMMALRKRHEELGVLHIDAHLDLRDAYEGFKYSHASIMRNVSEGYLVKKFVHVGIRDFCREEHQYVTRYCGQHSVYYDRALTRLRFGGMPWETIVKNIIEELPFDVYVSFDIDGLDPSLCPNTGTPVPGGLQFEEAMYLIERVVESGRKIVGFDLVEVAPASDNPETWEGDWNTNVGMRVLYRLACLALESHRK